MAEPRVLHQRFLPDGGEHAYVWKYSDPLGGRRPRHFHAEPEVNLVVRGAATFGVGDRVVRVAPGEMLVFPSGQDHVLLEASPDLYLYAIGLDALYSTEVLGARREPLVPLHVRIGASELSQVLDRAAEVVDCSGKEQLAAELWERIHWVSRRAVDVDGRRPHVLTRRVLRLLGAAPELSLETLASDLRAHPSEISRHFHRDLGITPVRYRTRLRLLNLIRLVDEAGHDLSTAASTAGFGSYSQCHRTFHAELGCSPQQFFSEIRERMQLAYTG